MKREPGSSFHRLPDDATIIPDADSIAVNQANFFDDAKRRQARLAEVDIFGGGYESFQPPAMDREDFFGRPEDELEATWPARFRRFRRARELRSGLVRALEQPSADSVDQPSREPELSEAERQRMTGWFFMINSLARYIDRQENAPAMAGEIRLRPKQLEVYKALLSHLEKDNSKGYFTLPTGFGKTVLFSKIIAAISQPPERGTREFRENAHARTLIVVPTLQLIDQTVSRLGEFAPGVDVGTISSHQKKRWGNDATVITYDSFTAKVESGELRAEDFDLVILDEVHEGLSARRKSAMQGFIDQSTVLGFTATDEYNESKKVADLLEHNIFSMDINDAVENGLLCPYTAEEHDTHIDLSEVEITAGGTYNEDQLEKVIDYARRATQALQMYLDRFSGQPCYLFCENTKAAKITAEVFARGGVTAAAITSKGNAAFDAGGVVHRMPAAVASRSKERDYLWRRFTKGQTQALANVDMFSRGSDSKSASVCFNLAPSRSKVQVMQRGGRVLRLDENNPDKHAYGIDFQYHDTNAKRAHKPITFKQLVAGEPVVVSIASDREGDHQAPEEAEPTEDIGLDDVDLNDISVTSELADEFTKLGKAPSPPESIETDTDIDPDSPENIEKHSLMLELDAATEDAEWIYDMFTTDPDIEGDYQELCEISIAHLEEDKTKMPPAEWEDQMHTAQSDLRLVEDVRVSVQAAKHLSDSLQATLSPDQSLADIRKAVRQLQMAVYDAAAELENLATRAIKGYRINMRSTLRDLQELNVIEYTYDESLHGEE